MVNSLLFVNATTNAIITSSESTATMYIQCTYNVGSTFYFIMGVDLVGWGSATCGAEVQYSYPHARLAPAMSRHATPASHYRVADKSAP
jgi:hypothetical protein